MKTTGPSARPGAGFRRALGLILLLAAAAGLGCTPGTPALKAPVKAPEAFSASGARKVPDRWWSAFDSKALNASVDEALKANFDLKTAWQRLRAARAVAERERAARFPELEAFAGGEVSRTDGADREQLRLGLSSAYELDLWGRIHSAAEAEEYRARASLADYQAAALSLSAEVVRTWYQVRAALARKKVLEDQVRANRKVLLLLEKRFATGQSRSVDILRQRQLLEATGQQLHAAASRIRVLKHQLAVLLGKTPRKAAGPEAINSGNAPLPELPPLPRTGLPSTLVRRRPDVRSAYRRLQAADRELAVAISSRYPRLNLSAALTSTTQGAGTLFEDWVRSLSGDLAAPLFDAGRRAAEVDRSEALRQQRLYEYGQRILTAFREVEDALVQEDKQRRQLESLERQLRLAAESYARLRVEYINGVGNFIDVLTALTEMQQLRRESISAKLVLIEYRIALYRALAGGFSTERQKTDNRTG